MLGDVDGLGRRRARLRHGVLLGVARAARRAAGRRRPRRRRSSRPRGGCRRSSGSSSRSSRRAREDVPLPDASFDLAVLRVRRVDLGRSRTAGSPRRRGCCGRAAGSSSSRTRRSSMLCATTRRRDRRDAAAAAARHAPDRVAGRRTRSSSTSATATGSTCCARNGFEVERLIELHAPEDARRAVLRLRDRRLGAKWPAEEIWEAREDGCEAPRLAPPLAPRVDLAAAARDPRAARDPVRGRRARYEETMPGADPVEHARAGKARSVDARPATGPCSASTRRSSATARVLGKPADAGRGAEHARALSRAGRTRSSRASACSRPAWEELQPRDDARRRSAR